MIEDLLQSLTPAAETRRVAASTKRLQEDTIEGQLRPRAGSLEQFLADSKRREQTAKERRGAANPTRKPGSMQKTEGRVDFTAFSTAYQLEAAEPVRCDSIPLEEPDYDNMTAESALEVFEREVQGYFEAGEALLGSAGEQRRCQPDEAADEATSPQANQTNGQTGAQRRSLNELTSTNYFAGLRLATPQTNRRFETLYSPERKSLKPMDKSDLLATGERGDWAEEPYVARASVGWKNQSSPQEQRAEAITQPDGLQAAQYLGAQEEPPTAPERRQTKTDGRMSEAERQFYEHENERLRSGISELVKAYRLLQGEIKAAGQRMSDIQSARSDISARYEEYSKEVRAMLAIQPRPH